MAGTKNIRVRMPILWAFLANSAMTHAASFCVSSNLDLQAAMDAVAQIQNESHHVMIAAGEYQADIAAFSASVGLTLEGGYDAECATQIPGAQRTVIRASAASVAGIIAQGGDLVISDISLDGYVSVEILQQGIGFALQLSRMAIVLGGSNQANVQVRRMDGGPVSVDNFLIDTETDSCAMDTRDAALNYVTIVNRGNGRGLCSIGATSIVNSVIFAVYGNDIETPDFVLARYSVFDDFGGSLDPLSTENLPGPILFENSQDHLLRDQPADVQNQVARDSGECIPFPLDILGARRVVGSIPDRGAFEIKSDRIMKSSFDIVASGCG